MSLNNKTLIVFLSAALIMALGVGWGWWMGSKSSIVFILGFPGGCAMILIIGVHGTMNSILNGVGAVAFIVVNAAVYFFIMLGIAKALKMRCFTRLGITDR